MKIRTKMEQIGLKKLSKNSKKVVSIFYRKEDIDKQVLSKIGEFFGSKSPKVIAEKAIGYTVSSLVTPNKDLLELSKLEKLELVRTIQNRQIKNVKQGNMNFINVRVPLWQLTIIASQSNKNFKKERDLISFSLTEVFNKLSVLFGEV